MERVSNFPYVVWNANCANPGGKPSVGTRAQMLARPEGTHELSCPLLTSAPLPLFAPPPPHPALSPAPLPHLSPNEYSVDPGTALRSTVEGLKGAGWGRHTFLVPGLGYCILIPLFLWFLTIASFESTCPAFLAPVQRACELRSCDVRGPRLTSPSEMAEVLDPPCWVACGRAV